MKRPRPREKEVQAAVRAYLAIRRAFDIRTNSGAVQRGRRYVRSNDRPGCSDLIVCYRGRFLALEVKRDGREGPTDEQRRFLAEVRELGQGVGAVVTGIDDVRAILDRIDAEIDGHTGGSP